MTLRIRLSMWVAALLLVVLIGFGAFVYESLERGLEATVDDSLRLAATQTDASLNVENGKIDFRDMQPENDTFASLQERGLTVRILDPAGGILHTLGPNRAIPVGHAVVEVIRMGRPSFETLRDPRNAASVRVYTLPIREEGQTIGFVQVAQTLGVVHDSLRQLLSALLLGGPLLVLIAAAGGFLLASRTLAPIDRITSTARRISAEGLGARLDIPLTNDEVGRLAATFNEMLARLEDAFRRERRFTADASHELRTPLTAMQVILSVVREKPRAAEDYEQALSDISDEVERLRTLTEDLLRLARGDTRGTTTRETVDLSEMLRDVIESLRPLAETKRLAFVCSIADGLVLPADQDALIRLFINIMDNAVKFTERGSIKVDAHAGPHEYVVMVSDTGIGIPAEHLLHVFERFYRVDKSRSGRGAGLGLAIAKEIALAHGGSIELASTPGSGTTATVRLPR